MHVVFEAAEALDFIFSLRLELILGLRLNFLVALANGLDRLVLVLSVYQGEVLFHFLAMFLLPLDSITLRHYSLLLDLLQLLLERLLVVE